MTNSYKHLIDEKALHKIRDIALNEYNKAQYPNPLVLHMEALHQYLSLVGYEPSFVIADELKFKQGMSRR